MYRRYNPKAGMRIPKQGKPPAGEAKNIRQPTQNAGMPKPASLHNNDASRQMAQRGNSPSKQSGHPSGRASENRTYDRQNGQPHRQQSNFPGNQKSSQRHFTGNTAPSAKSAGFGQGAHHPQNFSDSSAPPKKKMTLTTDPILGLLPPSVYNPETKKVLGFLAAEDLLLAALIFLLLDSPREDDSMMVYVLLYLLVSDYVDLPF